MIFKIRLPVLLILMLTAFSVYADPKVYGKLHLSLGQLESESGGTTTTDNIQLRSFASRFGVKGAHDLAEGLQATYKLEYEVNPDDENIEDPDFDSGSAGLKRRNQYLGIKGGFGEIRLGRHDTPLKLAQGKFDQFNDTDADLKNGIAEDGEHRFDNMILYLGNSGSIAYSIALVPGEGDGDKTIDGGTGTGDGVADTLSASISYKDGPVYLALAHDQYDDTDGQESNTLSRLVGIYKFGGMQIGLLYQTGVESASVSDDEVDAIGLSFNAKTGNAGKVKLQYITSEDNADAATEITLMAVGYEHKYSKTTSSYVMYSNVEEDNSASTDEDTFLGAGLVVKF